MLAAPAAEGGAPIPDSAPRHRPWWSPRRAFLPLAAAALLGGGLPPLALDMVEDRKESERRIKEAREEIVDHERDIERFKDQIASLEPEIERAHASGRDCLEAARKGVGLLKAVIRFLQSLSRGSFLGVETARLDLNRLIKQSYDASTACYEGLP